MCLKITRIIPASTLTNGIVSSENWNKGEGWESSFDGEYEYGGYMEVGEREQLATFGMGAGATRPRQNRNQRDYGSVDLYGSGIDSTGSTAVGWAVIQFAEGRVSNPCYRSQCRFR